ncbi:hypothetical protein ABK040_000127 [Willaertia magna]
MQKQQPPLPSHIKRTELQLVKAASSKLYYICKFPKPLPFNEMTAPVKVRLKGQEDEELDILDRPKEEEDQPLTEEELAKQKKVRRKQKNEYILEDSATPRKKSFEGQPEETQDAKYALFIIQNNALTGQQEFGVLPVSSQWINFRTRITKPGLGLTADEAEKFMKSREDAMNKRWQHIKPEIAEENKKNRRVKKEKEVKDEWDFEEVVDDDEQGEFVKKISHDARVEAQSIFGEDDEEEGSSSSSEDEDDEKKRAKEELKKQRDEYKKLLKKEKGEAVDDEEENEDSMLQEKIKNAKKRAQEEIKVEDQDNTKKVKTGTPTTSAATSSSSSLPSILPINVKQEPGTGSELEKLKQQMLKYIKKKGGSVKVGRFKKKFFKGYKTDQEKEARKDIVLQAMKEIGAKSFEENGKKIVKIE